MDSVNIDIFNGIFAQEGRSLFICLTVFRALTQSTGIGRFHSDMPGTAVSISGGYEKKVSEHGYTRRSYITSFNVIGYTERTYRTGTFHNQRHWDCTVVVSYSGLGLYLPEGVPLNIPNDQLPPNIQADSLRRALALKSGR